MSKIIAPVLFIIVAIGLYFTYINHSYNAILAFQALETRLDQAFKEYENLERERESLLSRYAQLQPSKDSLYKMLPDEIDTSALIIDINTLALVNNLTIHSFDLGEMHGGRNVNDRSNTQALEDGVSKGIMGIDLSGPYENMKSFLSALESSLTLLDVVSLSVDTKGSASSEEKVDPGYTLVVQAYWLR